jgi:hypothetical protein
LDTRVTACPSARRFVVAKPKPAGQHVGVGVVELDAQGSARLVDLDRLIQVPVLDPQIVEEPQRSPREVAELGMMPLPLELRDHHDREDDGVLGEAQRSPGIGQQDGGIEHERAKPRGEFARGFGGGRALRDGHKCSLAAGRAAGALRPVAEVSMVLGRYPP